jgi:hypothetical protein
MANRRELVPTSLIFLVIFFLLTIAIFTFPEDIERYEDTSSTIKPFQTVAYWDNVVNSINKARATWPEFHTGRGAINWGRKSLASNDDTSPYGSIEEVSSSSTSKLFSSDLISETTL